MSTSDFNPRNYGPAVQELIEPQRVSPLEPGTPNASARKRLEALTDATLFAGRPVVDPRMAAACRAGLWLYHDDLDRSHSISQEIETPTGSFWHAIMHRREGDFSNSKYWFHRVGSHPVFEPLADAARTLASAAASPGSLFLTKQTAWDPFRFVDLVQRSIGSGSNEESLCQAVQRREWELLFDFCYQRATGGA